VQDEELRRSRAELEATLLRQVQLYDFAPVGCFTVDRVTVVRELNLTAASMLGSERDQLLGRPLDSFLAPESARVLHAMLTSDCNGTPTKVYALRLSTRNGAARHVHATVNRDPEGEHFLVAFVFVAEDEKTPKV
jgi:PAS domain S-box-containing protein